MNLDMHELTNTSLVVITYNFIKDFRVTEAELKKSICGTSSRSTYYDWDYQFKVGKQNHETIDV